VLILGLFAVFSYPQSNIDDEPMQNDDDFDYTSEDQSAPSPQTKASQPNLGQKVNKTATVTGIRGEDVKLQCDVGNDVLGGENAVVLWYFGANIVANGKNVVQPNLELDMNNYDLTILKASAQDAGTYLCKVLPTGSEVTTKVVIAEHSLDAIAPESSTSKSAATAVTMSSSFLAWTLLGSALVVLGLGKH
ncbi:hypothetical protein KR018_004348, partial [Drosophila ironensis]